MAGRQDHRVGGVRVDPQRGFPQAPTVRIYRTAEVTPAGVGIRVVGYPRHRQRLRPGGEGSAIDLRAVSVQGTRGGITGERGHPPASKIGGIGPSLPKSDGP